MNGTTRSASDHFKLSIIKGKARRVCISFSKWVEAKVCTDVYAKGVAAGVGSIHHSRELEHWGKYVLGKTHFGLTTELSNRVHVR